MSDIKEKACRRCRKVIPVDDFYENKYSPDGRYAFCKVCFDQFAQKLKEKENSPAPQNKTCEKCDTLRLIDEFDDHPDNPGTQSDWCKECRQPHDDLKKQVTETEKKPDLPPPKATQQTPRDLPDKKSKKKKTTPEPLRKATPEPVPELMPQPTDKPAPEKSLELEPEPASEQTRAMADEFDYIEHLLETQALEKMAPYKKLPIPKQITKIKARKRICNGCGKTEEIDQVEKNTIIPVHAWFCDLCRQRTTKRLMRKGMTVHDYWGREFKIKKFISSDMVMGILKNKNGNWEKRPLKIYGNWKTP